ncbi:MAG: hypothetical protein P9M04_01530 [Candidatus Orphnella occulta]|nr:hypothetical protein [Candidatus Orphnella occulta]
MVQMDGSHHKWFTGVDKKYVLMGYVDDATSRVYANFYRYEGTNPQWTLLIVISSDMVFLREYI